MLTFSGGYVREKQRLNFTKITHLIMDVTIGHVFDMPNNLAKKYSKYGIKRKRKDANTKNITNNNV